MYTRFPHTVFVYGSLLREFHNHGLLRGEVFEAEGVTVDEHRMCSLGGFPAAVKASTPGAEHIVQGRIAGEVYHVTSETFERLDRLEGNGSLYQREQIKVQIECKGGRMTIDAWIYFLCWAPSSEDLARRWNHGMRVGRKNNGALCWERTQVVDVARLVELGDD